MAMTKPSWGVFMILPTCFFRILATMSLVTVGAYFGVGSALAFCQHGDVKACVVNSQPGEQTCGSNGIYGPCYPTVPPAPPVPAAPTVTGRSDDGHSLTVRWSDSTMWSTAFYQLQYRDGSSWVEVATLAASPTTFTHSGLQSDTLYCYRVEVTADTGTRASTPTCRYTTDGTRREVSRLQIEFHTSNVGDAGTDDDFRVVLTDSSNGGWNYTWINYGRNDFERGDTFTYDLNLDGIQRLSDISKIKIIKDGTDGWCLADYRLLVNEVPVFAEDFHQQPGGCRWLDEDDGHQPTYEVAHDQIRAHPLWQGYSEPQRLGLDLSAFPQVTATLHIPRTETEQRLEGMIGHLIHGSEGHWGDMHGRAYVEADPGDSPGRIAVDLDLEADVPWWFDPELDIDFDLHFEAQCSDDQTAARIDVTTEDLHTNVDFNWFTDFLQFLLLPPCTVAGCLEDLENYIAGKVEAGFEPIVQSQQQSLPQGFRCMYAETVIHDNADVDLVFHVLAPDVVTPLPTHPPVPRPSPPPNDPPPSPCENGAQTSARRVCP